MVRHGNLLLRRIPEPKKLLAAAEVAAFTLATSEATHTLTGRIEPATVEVSEGTAIPVVQGRSGAEPHPRCISVTMVNELGGRRKGRLSPPLRGGRKKGFQRRWRTLLTGRA